MFISLLVVLVAGLVLVGCQETTPSPTQPSSTQPSSTQPAGNAPEKIIIGGTTAQTGIFSAMGVGATYSSRRAVEDINKLGGIYLSKYNKRVPVEYILVDDQSDENLGASLAEDLILRDKIQFFVSPNGFPNMVMPKQLVTERYKIIHVSSILPLEPMLATDREYSWFQCFGIATPIEDQNDFRYGKRGYTIIDTWTKMIEDFGDQTNMTFGFFASDDSDGVAWYAGFPVAIESIYPDAKIIGVENKLGLFPVGTTDFSATIQAWKNGGVEILWGNSNGPDFGVLYRQAQSMGFKPKMVGAARAALMPGDINSWGGDLPNGVGIEIWGAPTMKGNEFIGNTTQEQLNQGWYDYSGGQYYNQMVTQGYWTLQTLFKAIEMAGDIDTEAVQKAFHNMDYISNYGRVKFDKDNIQRAPIVYGQWMKGTGEFPWELKIVSSYHDFLPVDAAPIFPIP